MSLTFLDRRDTLFCSKKKRIMNCCVWIISKVLMRVIMEITFDVVKPFSILGLGCVEHVCLVGWSLILRKLPKLPYRAKMYVFDRSTSSRRKKRCWVCESKKWNSFNANLFFWSLLLSQTLRCWDCALSKMLPCWKKLRLIRQENIRRLLRKVPTVWTSDKIALPKILTVCISKISQKEKIPGLAVKTSRYSFFSGQNGCTVLLSSEHLLRNHFWHLLLMLWSSG